MSNIKKFYPKNAADDPDNVLEQALGNYDEVIIIGTDKNGSLDVRASNNVNNHKVIFLIELFKMKLLRGDYT